MKKFYHFVFTSGYEYEVFGLFRQIYTSSELKNHLLEIHSIYWAPIV